MGTELVVINIREIKLLKTVLSNPQIITPEKAIKMAIQVLNLISSLSKKKAKIAPNGTNN
tara:strand:+ start:406 stop:585 length:180 start_codon:yes stop_codon:yes gene_type:complete